MDIFTQSLLGSVLALSVAKKSDKKIAAIIGAVAGLLADADIFIYSSNDPLLNIEFHRHFTHSIFFVPVGAAIAFALLWPFFRQRITPKRLYLYCFAGYSMSGVLDAFTSYGTLLFWPFSEERVAWKLISIIDPVFTVTLLVALILSLRFKHKQIAAWGLGLCGLYLLMGFIQLQRAETVANELALSRGHSTTHHMVKPTLANQILWRSVYAYNNRIYVDAIRLGIFSENKVFQGQSVDQFIIEKALPELKADSTLYTDIKRFTHFSDGFVAYNLSQKNVLGDLRYGMLPITAKPLWGIVIDINKPDEHADYQFFRDNSYKVRQTFFNMIVGQYTK